MKILLVATVQSHICQFHKPLIEMLKADGHQVDVCARNNLSEKKDLFLDNADNVFDIPFARSPFSKDNLKAKKELKKIILENKYDIVHCNTPVGGVLTRQVCKRINKKVRPYVIYEAHGFHFYKGAPKKNWLIWYNIEKHYAKPTDLLITLNHQDYKVASSKFKAKSVEYVAGVGVNLSQFKKNEKTLTKADIGLKEDDKMIFSVGELNDNKNQQVIIRALALLNDKSVHYVVCGNGKNLDALQNLAKELGVSENVHFMGYRRDIAEFDRLADVFAFSSIREGLPVSPLEAMSLGVPVVCSKCRGVEDYTEDGKTGFSYNYNDVEGFAEGIKKVLFDDELKEQIRIYNIEKAKEFSLEKSMAKMKEIYSNIIGSILNR